MVCPEVQVINPKIGMEVRNVKKKLLPLLALVLALGLLIPMAIPVAAECPPPPECPPPHAGCTPGFWKNHTDLWTGYSTSQTLESVLDVPDVLGLDNYTLLEALSFGGGPGATGMARNLLRQAVAALLNAAHPLVNYPMTEGAVIGSVNYALASLNRGTMETLKDQLDAFNNLGCPIDAHGNLIDG